MYLEGFLGLSRPRSKKKQWQKEKKKESIPNQWKANISMEKKKYVFKAWVLLISFIGKRVVSTSVRKLSSPSDIRRNRGLFRGSRIHILRQLFRKLSQPLSQNLLLLFFPPILHFFFFFLRRTKFSPQTSRKRIRSCLIISRKLQCNL